MHIQRMLCSGALSLLSLFVASAVHASTTYDLTIPGTPATETGSGCGNALEFDHLTATDFTVTAWGTTGLPNQANDLLDISQILRFSTGLGACNQQEGADCYNPIHQVDNVGDDDLILFVFDQRVQFDDIVINPYGTYDRDVSFWIADIVDTNLSGLDPQTLIDGSSVFGNRTNDFNGRGSGALTIDLGSTTGNALLFGAYLNLSNDPGKKKYDRFKIESLTTTAVVPVPAALWLFGSGLIGLVAVARRKQPQSGKV